MRNLLFIVLLVSAITMFYLAVVAWKKRSHAGNAAVCLTIVMFGVSIYNFGYAFELVSDTLTEMMFWVRFQHLGIHAITPAWFLFSLIISGRERLINQRQIAILLIVPITVFIASQTLGSSNWLHINPHIDESGAFPTFAYQRSFFTYLLITYVSICLAATTIFYTFMLFHASSAFRKQAAIYWLSSIIPWVAGIIYNFGFSPKNLDITPLAFSISGILLGIGFLQFHLLDILPLARDVIFEGMNDGVLVFDLKGIIVDLNPRLMKMLPEIKKNYFGRPVDEVMADYPDLVDQIRSRLKTPVELRVVDGEAVYYYRSSLSPLPDGRGEVVGNIVMLHDFSSEKTLMQELEILAQHDSLTGVYNRRHFMKLASSELYRQERYGGALSLIMLDLDNFKRINDTYGHAAGDAALEMVVRIMKPLLRKSDIIGRFGGEEFFILLPQTEPETCMAVIERLRSAVELQNIDYEGM